MKQDCQDTALDSTDRRPRPCLFNYSLVPTFECDGKLDVAGPNGLQVSMGYEARLGISCALVRSRVVLIVAKARGYRDVRQQQLCGVCVSTANSN